MVVFKNRFKNNKMHGKCVYIPVSGGMKNVTSRSGALVA